MRSISLCFEVQESWELKLENLQALGPTAWLRHLPDAPAGSLIYPAKEALGRDTFVCFSSLE